MAVYVSLSATAPTWLVWTTTGLVFVALFCVALAAKLANARVSRVRSDFDELAQAMDRAVRDLAARSSRDATTIADIQARIGRDLHALRAAMPARQSASEPSTGERDMETEAGNVVPYPQSRLARKTRDAKPRGPESVAEVEALVRQALASESLDLSLRPIISMSRGAAAGFDVFAHFDTAGDGVDLAAGAAEIPEGQRRAFEVLMVEEAIGTARRRLGSVSQTMPLHISVSEAFLVDGQAVSKLIAAARAHDPLAGALVLCIPESLSRRDGPCFAVLQHIADSGIRLALEDWAPGAEIALPAELQIAFVKVNAQRLIDEGAGTALPARILDAGAVVVAVDVGSDEEAMALIDENVNLMSGPRFSGPRRLRPDDDGAIERLSRISVYNA